MRTLTRPIIAAVAVASLLSACSSGAKPEANLDSIAGIFGWDTEYDEAAYADQEARIQESIRVCMTEAGFQYTPVVYDYGPGPVEYTDEDELERITRDGFGITTWIGRDDEDPGIIIDDFGDWEDPNADYVNSLSESEMAAYYEALYGREEDIEYTVEVDPETGEEYRYSEGWGGGCQGEAYEAEYGEQDNNNDIWEDLDPLYQELNLRVEADSRIIALDTKWAACMTGNGYDYASQSAMWEVIYDDFSERLTAIVGENFGYWDPFEGWTQEEMDAFFETATEEDWNNLYAQEPDPSENPAYDAAALTALQEEEIALALSDHECGSTYWEDYQEIYAEIEAAFVNENRAEFERIRDEAGGE